MLSLSQVVQSKEFIEELYRVATITREEDLEGSFLIWTRDYEKFGVNKAVKGYKKFDDKGNLVVYISPGELTPATPDNKPGFGAHTPIDSYSVLYVHSHPNHPDFKSRLGYPPSYGDIRHSILARGVNRNLLERNADEHHVTYNGKIYLVSVSPVYSVAYINADQITLFLWQQRLREPLTTVNFLERLKRAKIRRHRAKYLRRKSVEELDFVLGASGVIAGTLRSTSQLLSDCGFVTGTLNIKDGQIQNDPVLERFDRHLFPKTFMGFSYSSPQDEQEDGTENLSVEELEELAAIPNE